MKPMPSASDALPNNSQHKHNGVNGAGGNKSTSTTARAALWSKKSRFLISIFAVLACLSNINLWLDLDKIKQSYRMSMALVDETAPETTILETHHSNNGYEVETRLSTAELAHGISEEMNEDTKARMARIEAKLDERLQEFEDKILTTLETQNNNESSDTMRKKATLMNGQPKNSKETPAANNNDASLLGLPSTPYKHTLKVPFYVYENIPGLDWSTVKLVYNDTQKKDKPLADSASVPPQNWKYKHDDDYWFHYHALRHPTRTRDPSKAKLFFVPIYLNAFARYANEEWKHHSFCLQQKQKQNHTSLICNWDLFWHASNALKDSPWFQKQSGRDHILVHSHFYSNSKRLHSRTSKASFYQCNTLTFERKSPNVDRVHIPSMYIGSPCEWTSNSSDEKRKLFDFTMISHLHPGKPSFQTRRNICDWITRSSSDDDDSSKNKNFSVALCGQGEQCPALSNARYGFHARGDTYGSNRLMDTLLSGTIPLFTDEEQYDIIPDFVPWKELSYFVNVSSPEVFRRSLTWVLDHQRDEYESKLQLIVDNLHLLDHTRGGQFDAYMARFAELLGIS